MKTYNYLKLTLIAATLLFGLNSCVKKDITIPLTITVTDFTVPAMPKKDDWNEFGKTNALTGIKKLITDNGGDPAQLKSVKLTSMNLTITSGQNFNDVKYLEGFINDDVNKFAYKTEIPTTGLTTIDLDNQYSELVSQFQGDSIKLNVRAFVTASTSAMKASSVMKFNVTVGPAK